MMRMMGEESSFLPDFPNSMILAAWQQSMASQVAVALKKITDARVQALLDGDLVEDKIFGLDTYMDTYEKKGLARSELTP
jgi:hypothetical protein